MNYFVIKLEYIDDSVSIHFVDSYASEWFVLESCLAHCKKPIKWYQILKVDK
jgi:hypothetical protein